MENLYVRPLLERDVKVIGGWAKAEGWWDSEVTIWASVSHCPSGWLAAELNGKLIGCIAACKAGDDVTTFGYLTVAKDYRRQGVARTLIREMKSRHAGENISFTSVDGMVDTYKRYFNNAVTSFKVKSLLLLTKSIKRSLISHSFDLKEFDPAKQMDELVRYDRDVHVIPRRNLLRIWFTGEGVHTSVAMHDGKIVGYACLQPVYNNTKKIGPLYADTPEVARALFNRLVTLCPIGSRVGIIVVEDNEIMRKIVSQHDIRAEYSFTRMFTERHIDLRLVQVYALTDCGVNLM